MQEDNGIIIKRLFAHTLSEDPHIRAAAYRALGCFNPEYSIVTCLLNGLNDKDAAVRRSAGSSLINLGYLNPDKPLIAQSK